MNLVLLSTDIVTKIRNSMQDSALNQALVVEGMIREALDTAQRARMMRNFLGQVQTLPEPEWPPANPHTPH